MTWSRSRIRLQQRVLMWALLDSSTGTSRPVVDDRVLRTAHAVGQPGRLVWVLRLAWPEATGRKHVRATSTAWVSWSP